MWLALSCPSCRIRRSARASTLRYGAPPVLVTAVAAEALTGAASWVHSLRQSYGGALLRLVGASTENGTSVCSMRQETT
jgi:hypothetical protein